MPLYPSLQVVAHPDDEARRQGCYQPEVWSKSFAEAMFFWPTLSQLRAAGALANAASILWCLPTWPFVGVALQWSCTITLTGVR